MAKQTNQTTASILAELLEEPKRELERIKKLKKEFEKKINENGWTIRDEKGIPIVDCEGNKVPTPDFELYQLYNEQYIDLNEKLVEIYRKIKNDQVKARNANKRANQKEQLGFTEMGI